MRIAYVWPSGEIESNRYASAYWAVNPSITLQKNSNNGDLFVTEASLRLTTPSHVECFDPARLTEKMLQRLNSDFDFVFVRGANTLSDEVYAGILADFLEKVRLPLVVMGIGIQAPSKSKMPQKKDVHRLIQLLGERSKMVGVRGAITAEFVRENGVDHVQIVGCPSILRHNRPDLRLERPDWSELRSFGFSLTRYYSGWYQRDRRTFLSAQARLIKELHAAGRVGLITQGEREEKAFAFRDPETMELATQELRKSGWFDPQMEEIYRSRSVFFGTTATSYDMHVRNFDVVFGTRLHANAMAVACGVPAITLTFDLRAQEIYEFWRLPAMTVEDADKLPAREIYERADFEPFNRHIGFVYHNFRQYLDANGVPHVMQAEKTAEGR
jgi:hypothetical protein